MQKRMKMSTISTIKKATLYLDPRIHKALRLRAAETDQSISEITNQMLIEALSEDIEDLQAIEERKHGSFETYQQFIKGLKADGLL